MKLVLLPESSRVFRSTVEAIATGEVVACDFHVDAIEVDGSEVPGGYRVGRVLNIDHHAPTRRMARIVSSANLALEHVRVAGPTKGTVVINHTDCDSILSSGIVGGDLPADPRFGAAAIAADHTGTADPIADLLSGLWNRRDVDLSRRNLRLLLDGRPLEADAQAASDNRRRQREEAARLVAIGRFVSLGPVAFADLTEDIDGVFFPALLPDAVVVATGLPGEPGRRVVKLRLGGAAPAGFSLHSLRLTEFDPVYGGRWNAGSNRRGGGTTLSLADYAGEVARRVSETIRRAIG